jgi:MauM/NapG family ferredoxin protein
MSKDRPVDRRRFFREGLRELLKPLAQSVEPLEKAITHFNAVTGKANTAGNKVELPFLRPPGALKPDQSFLDTCSRCGKCVEVCPANCIVIDSTGTRGSGAPFIDPTAMPCVVCEGLNCMNICPTGALKLVPVGEINMGLAVWNETTCVRSKGQECKLCVDKCPEGSKAIELSGNKIVVHEAGCIGCGVCQYECPTWPKSIVVRAS